ncbi:PEP-CTERM sorting domain-containing protein [Pontiellaceae bacterium B12227]|nr:PEP-CTERM sorting domain-containing protein [Pontiellaceae bacterium B12227]
MKRKLEIICVVLLSASVAQAAVYTWNGSANDGDWTTPANWDGGLVPASLTAADASEDTIIFSGANMPTLNVATFAAAGYGADTATMIFNSGGTFALDFSTSQNAAPIMSESRTLLTVGDGVGGGTEDVVVYISGMLDLLRHTSSTATYLVKSDGTLNFAGDIGLYNDNNKDGVLQLDGGAIVATGTIDARFNNIAESYVEFLSEGGAITAAYGGAYADFTAVLADASGNFIDTNGGGLEFTNNGTTFTVTAIPEPATLGLVMAFGGGILFVRRIIQM